MDFKNLPDGTIITVYTRAGNLKGKILTKKTGVAPFNLVYAVKLFGITTTIWVYSHEIVSVEDDYIMAWDRAMRGI